MSADRSWPWPDGVVARPLDKGDVAAWADLLAAVERVDDEGENYDADDLLEELADPKLDLANDTLGLWGGDQLVGYSKIWTTPGATDTDRVRVEGRIHPGWRRRGLGAALLAWGCERAAAAHAERNPDVPGEIHAGGIVTNVGEQALYRSAGFTPQRYFFSMERDLAEPIPEVDDPDSLRVVAFDPRWDGQTHVAHNEAFLDHWGSRPRDLEDWHTWVTGARAFRGPMSHLALDGDEVAAYVLGYEYTADTEVTGVRELYVGQVGTRRPYRGRGVARALLARTLAAAKADGYARLSLGVDAENPTGALGLYERLGFVVRRKFVTSVRPLS